MRLSADDRERRDALETASAKLDEVEAAFGRLILRLRQVWRHNPQIGLHQVAGIEDEFTCVVDACHDGHELVKSVLESDRKRRGNGDEEDLAGVGGDVG